MTPAHVGSTLYLSAQPPALAMIQAGLSVFAVFIIARHCLRWLCLRTCASPDGRPWVTALSRAPRGQSSPLANEKLPRYAPRLLAPVMKDEQTPVPQRGQPADAHDGWKRGADSLPRPLISRLPPAPPLTPPELSSAVFTIDDAPHRQDSFIHQPNPDYMASGSSFPDSTPEPRQPPRRRSYHRIIPMGTPPTGQASSPDANPADLVFSPASYPPTSPLLPPPPPGGAGAHDARRQARRGVEVKGEIISILDGGGAGWTRHTRVYGGGVCLACAASSTQDGNGGFYGATVAPEEMR